MHIFYTPGIVGEFYELNEEESRHCVKVLRMKTGDQVQAIDGEGGLYEGEIIAVHQKRCAIQIHQSKQNYKPLAYDLTVAIAPTKKMDRFEWFLEKATEIGVSRIVPIICERSERSAFRSDRVEKVVVAAMKQSVRAYKPKIESPVAFYEWIKRDSNQNGYIAHCHNLRKESLWKIALSDSIRIAIGPEGDFTKEEIKRAEECRFKGVSSGAYRLRTETAGILACSAVFFSKEK